MGIYQVGPGLLPVGNFSGGQPAGLNRAVVTFEGPGGLSLSFDRLAMKAGARGELEARSQPVAESWRRGANQLRRARVGRREAQGRISCTLRGGFEASCKGDHATSLKQLRIDLAEEKRWSGLRGTLVRSAHCVRTT